LAHPQGVNECIRKRLLSLAESAQVGADAALATFGFRAIMQKGEQNEIRRSV